MLTATRRRPATARHCLRLCWAASWDDDTETPGGDLHEVSCLVWDDDPRDMERVGGLLWAELLHQAGPALAEFGAGELVWLDATFRRRGPRWAVGELTLTTGRVP